MVRLQRRGFVVFGLALAIAGLVPAVAIAQSPTAGGGDCPTTTPEENLTIVETYLAALDSGDEAAIDAALHDEFSHNLSRGGMEVPNEPGNADELQQFGDAGGSEVAFTVDDIFGSGDRVAVRYSFDVAPEAVADSTATDPVIATAIAIVRIECGAIREMWVETDAATLLMGHGYTIGTAAASPAP
jgi:ketosteroid isomerase-like protein